MNQSTLLQGVYNELYVAAPLDFDYDEPNAVTDDAEMEFIAPPSGVQAFELPLTSVLVEEPAEQQPARPATILAARTAA